MLACNLMETPDDDTEVETPDWRDDTSEPGFIYMKRR